jgi:hypothetical protein
MRPWALLSQRVIILVRLLSVKCHDSATGSVLTPRNSYTATLLGSNNILMCGGFGFNGLLASCELFNICFGFGLVLPMYSCFSSTIQLNATEPQALISGFGKWLSLPNVPISDLNNPYATIVPIQNGAITLFWSSSLCSSSALITVLSPPTVSFSPLVLTLPSGLGCPSSVNLGVTPGVDVTGGTWSGYQPGSLSPQSPFSASFTWSSSQVGSTFNISFSPISVCTVPANVTVTISTSLCSTCPIFQVTTLSWLVLF